MPPTRPAGAAENLRLALGDEPEQLALAGTGTLSVREWNTLSVLIERAHALAAEEHFFHWEVAFPGVWRGWQSANPQGGFDAIVGNPPWDRMKMQEVEWFRARDPNVAKQKSKADRKAIVAALIESRAPLGAAYLIAKTRAEKSMERARKSGDYPLLSSGDTNLYALFVERAQSLIGPRGIAGLLTPSGILSDKPSEAFLKVVIPEGRVLFGIDFFNKKSDGKLFFEDVYYRFKFCVFVCARQRSGAGIGRYGLFVRDLADAAPERLVEIDEAMIREISPTAFLVPILRSEEDFELAVKLADGQGTTRLSEAGNLRYRTLFHMAGDSGLFVTSETLASTGAYPLANGNWRSGVHQYDRLFEGKMVQAFDHRSASIGFYASNVLRTGQSEITTPDEYTDPNFVAVPRFFVDRVNDRWPSIQDWCLAIKDVTSTTNTRSVIAALIPRVAAGHTLPILAEASGTSGELSIRTCANLNTFALDFFARQKIQNNHLTLHVLSQLPIIRPDAYGQQVGTSTRAARDLVRDHVLRLTYTAHDMAPFARDMGYEGPPFAWVETERRHLRARLDALYFQLYGITDEADIRYILSTFAIVERKDRAAWGGVYLTAELIIWYFRALAVGDTESVAPEAALLRQAARKAS